MPPVRALNKAKRRDAILDAAMALLGQRPSDEISTEEIAALAGVAPATVYNLVGTRSQLVTALVVRVLGRLAESLAELDPDQPIEAAQLVVDQTVAAFVANSSAFRQVVAIAQRSTAEHPLGIGPSDFQVAAMRRAQELGIIRDDLDAAALGRQIFISYTGALTLWSGGRLDDEGFAIAARHGLFTVLVAAATEAHRDGFVATWQGLGAALEDDAWHRTRPERPG